MAWLGGLFGGGSGKVEGASLVEDWNNYAKTRDLEAGPAGTASSSLSVSGAAPVGPSAAEQLFGVAAGAGALLGSSFTSVSRSVASTSESFSIPSGQQLTYFFALVAGGGVLLLLAFTIFLPVIILSPSKFALSFSLGCLLIFGGFAQLRGWKQQVAHMMARERLPFSAAYMGSILATLYAAMVMHSYLLSLLCSGAQVVTLLYFLGSYVPGGTAGVQFLLNLFYQAVYTCIGGVQRALMSK